MKRVLCIAPHFPPVNAPDVHRLRLSLRYFREFGWEPSVFAAAPEQVEGAKDDLLLRSLPEDVEIYHYGAVPATLTRAFGLGNLGFRSWFQLRAAVNRYLATRGADLIFFTTTVFASVAHGPYWKRRFGVPFVVDLQDPWRNDAYLGLPRSQRPPKFWFDHFQRARLEAATMPHAAGMIATSSSYIRTMRARYPALSKVPAAQIAFGSDPIDLEIAATAEGNTNIFEGFESCANGVYAGVAGPRAADLFEALFLAARRYEQSGAGKRFGLHFIGTVGALHAPPRLRPLAERYGVGPHVTERTERLPYFTALKATLDADFLIFVGSRDAEYTASKVASMLLANRPLLAIVHAQSDVAKALSGLGVEGLVTFSSDEPLEAIAARIVPVLARVLECLGHTSPRDPATLEPYLAHARAREIAALFDAVKPV